MTKENMISPILPFRAVVEGSAYPKDFTKESEFDVASDAAQAALAIGCLSDEDAVAVRQAVLENEDPEAAAKAKAEADAAAQAEADAKAKVEADAKAKADADAKTKSQGAAPENKTAGSAD